MRNKEKLIIAIDGPAGSGKSTIAKLAAKELGLLYIDTGAMYRALTLKALRIGLDLEDEKALTELARSTNIDLKEAGDRLSVIMDGEDVSGLIRTPELTNKVRFIARVPGVREEMVRLQRSIGVRGGAVLEGRDVGTVVFPDADYKFYLDADEEERTRRRYKELDGSGTKISIDTLKKDIAMRDRSDMKRAVGALKVADGAIVIDTTKMTVDMVFAKLISYIKCR